MVVAVLPLLEEAARLRGLAAAILRGLAARGLGGVLPDLPGTGDSLDAELTLLRLGKALRELVASLDREGRRVYLASIRSGALLDGSALAFGRWQLSPQTGAELLRDWRRVAKAAGGTDLSTVAGHAVSPALLAGLDGTEPMTASDRVRLRTVRFLSESRPADLKLPGLPPWRRAEPGHDPAIADTCAADIADWVRACDG